MKKIMMIISIVSLHASDNDSSVFFSAKVVDIKKMHQKYPNLEMHKAEKAAICYNPTLWEKCKNYFTDPNKISNNDYVYLFTTYEVIDELAEDRCIENVYVNKNHS